MERRITEKVTGYITTDGAGVSLVRVLGNRTVDAFDPILMLDSFDSDNPEDYIKGFPMHPHRGIETISYVYRGAMTHRDSLGNEDTITDGEVQWMTAGSGIMHEETLPASEKMLGVQLWLNLGRKDKMCPPEYNAVKNSDIEEIEIPGGKIRLLAGEYEGHSGYRAKYQPLDYYDIHLGNGAETVIRTSPDKSVMAFTLTGEAEIAGEKVEEKTAVKFTEGDEVRIKGLSHHCQVLFMSSERLDEPVVWGGPIVMNTDEELRKAFQDLRNGTFIQDRIEY